MRESHEFIETPQSREFTFEVQHSPNKALQLTANPLRGLPAAELGRQADNEVSV